MAHLSLISSLWSSPRHSRRRADGLARFTQLEDRILLAADLVIVGIQSQFSASTTVANQYAAVFQVTLKNQGTTAADLTGQHFNLSDNVQIKAVFTNAGFDYVDSNPVLAGGKVSGPDADSVSISLAPGAERTVSISGNFFGDPAFNAFRLKVDTTNVVAESDESNNINGNVFSTYGPLVNLFRSTFVLAPGKSAVIAPSGSAIDFNSPLLGGSVLQVSISNAKPRDTLDFLKTTVNGDPLVRKGSLLKLGNVPVATVSGGKGGEPLTFSFLAAADSSVIANTLQHVTFKSKKSQPGNRIVNFKFTDPDGRIGTGAVTINVS